jgi:hypothetical protein
VSYLARAIESAGIPTVCVYIEAFELNAQLMKPPRVLLTPHTMGRPIGLPKDRERHFSVIRAALRLLETSDHAPMLERFVPEAAEGMTQSGFGEST